MKLSSAILTSLFSVALMVTAPACMGTITDGGGIGTNDDPGPGQGPQTPEEEEQQALCVGDGQAGGACEVTGDCGAPMVCLNNVCVGPNDPSYTCDPIEGIECLQAGETCVNGLCIPSPGACETLDDCPNGYVCDAGQCQPERDGTVCADPGPGPALAGTYQSDSVLYLRQGLPGVVDSILDIAEDGRDLINGNVDLGLPSIVEAVVGGIVAGIIRQYVPPYGINIITALGNMSDILDTMRVEGTMVIDGVACDGNYRGHHEWDFVSFDFNGVPMRVAPGDIPGVDDVIPEEFSARYHCGDLLIDKHRIQNSMGGLIRWLLDNATNAITGHPNIESALGSIVDCPAVGSAVNNVVRSNCSFCPSVTGIASSACQGLVQAGVAEISKAIDEAAVKMSLIKLRAVVPVNPDGSLGQGTWYGSLAGGDFKGTLTTAQ